MKAHELDTKFDNNEEVLDHFDLTSARRPNQKPKRVNVDFPEWMVTMLDKEARRLGITRQSLIKIWLADRLEHRV